MNEWLTLARHWHEANRRRVDERTVTRDAGLMAAFWESTGRVCRSPITARRYWRAYA